MRIRIQSWIGSSSNYLLDFINVDGGMSCFQGNLFREFVDPNLDPEVKWNADPDPIWDLKIHEMSSLKKAQKTPTTVKK